MPAHFDVVVTDTAASLDPTDSLGPGREVQIEADAGNTLSVSWGSAALQNMSLAPGERQVVPVNYVAEVYVSVASGTENIHLAWIN